MEVVGRREGDTPQLRVDFDGSSGTTALARDAADVFLATFARTCPPSRASARADVLLAVSELVTNAVRHAPGPLTVCLTAVPDSIHISVRDTSVASEVAATEKADTSKPGHVAAPFQGAVTMAVAEGDKVAAGDTVATIEAMKMEASITAPADGTVERLAFTGTHTVEGGDLVLVLS